jgi:predicted nuclease of predicted toxin-antitoxin system
LLDAALSPVLARELSQRGIDTVHVRSLHLERADDSAILAKTADLGRVLVSRDADFAGLLAQSASKWPSFVHLRVPGLNAPAGQADMIVAVLEQHAAELEAGAILIVQHGRVRVRGLPVR